MLFDLRGKRRRLIQVIYAALAVLMGGGLVLFGIGSDTTGGLFDALGIRDSSSSASNTFDDQAERIEQRLRTNPRDEDLLLALVRARYSSGNVQVESDPTTGQQSYTQEALQEFELAADAWDRYLKQKPRQPNPNIALLAANALFALAQTSTDPNQAQSDLEDAARAQRIVAANRPSLGTYFQLALYNYFALDFKAGDRAAERTRQEAPQSAREQVNTQLTDLRKQAKQFQRQQRLAERTQGQQGAEQLRNPLGGLSGGGVSP